MKDAARISEPDKRLKKLLSLYTTISQEPEVVSRQMKKRVKEEGSPILTIPDSSIKSRYLPSYRDLKFF